MTVRSDRRRCRESWVGDHVRSPARTAWPRLGHERRQYRDEEEPITHQRVKLPLAPRGGDDEWSDLPRWFGRRDHVHSVLSRSPLMAPRIVTPGPDDSLIDTEPVIRGPTYLHWSPIVAGAIVTAAVSFVLISFGSGIGLAVASPSSSWRDTSSILALLGGLWLLLTSLAAFGLGGYLAGHLREILSTAPPDAVEFRDGIHGLLVWGLAIIMGALLTLSASRMVVARADLAAPTAATAEPLLAFELDRLFRSDRSPTELGNDFELRARAARILTTAVGDTGMEQADRDYLVRLVAARTGLVQPEAERRVDQAIAQAKDAIAKARHGTVILTFMIACSLLLGLPAAWLAAVAGGQHRDGAVVHRFWRRWEVDRAFIIR